MDTPLPEKKTGSSPKIIGLAVLALIILGGAYYMSTRPGQQVVQAQPQSAQQSADTPKQDDVQSAPTPVPPTPKALYGLATKNEGDVFTVQQILPGKEKSSKIYTVKTSDKTTFTYQKPPEEKNKPFKAGPGKLSDIKKDMFLFIMTDDDPETMTDITATQIMYSEKAAF